MRKIKLKKRAIEIIPVMHLTIEDTEVEVNEEIVNDFIDELGFTEFYLDPVPEELLAAEKEYGATVNKIETEARNMYIDEATSDGEGQTQADRDYASEQWAEIHDKIITWWDGIAQVLGAESYKNLVKKIVRYANDKRSDGLDFRDRQRRAWEELGYSPTRKVLTPYDFVRKYKPELMDNSKIMVSYNNLYCTDLEKALKSYIDKHRAEIIAILTGNS